MGLDWTWVLCHNHHHPTISYALTTAHLSFLLSCFLTTRTHMIALRLVDIGCFWHHHHPSYRRHRQIGWPVSDLESFTPPPRLLDLVASLPRRHLVDIIGFLSLFFLKPRIHDTAASGFDYNCDTRSAIPLQSTPNSPPHFSGFFFFFSSYDGRPAGFRGLPQFVYFFCHYGYLHRVEDIIAFVRRCWPLFLSLSNECRR